jgi:DNA-binding response OmpR family regulator
VAKRVLIIDDDELICAMLTTALTDAGYEAVTAGDALEGLEAAAKKVTAPDLILLDMQMPGGGVNTFIKLSRDPATSRIPVFFTTALPSHEVLPLLPASLQCSGYFQKPFVMTALLEQVKKILS